MGGDSHLEVVSMWVVVTGSVGEWMRGQDVVAREPSLGKQPPWRDGGEKANSPMEPRRGGRRRRELVQR